MQRLFEELQTLLTHAIQAPDTAIAQLEILGETEREKLLFTFNQTSGDLSPYQCLHPWFEEQVRQTPNQIAVILAIASSPTLNSMPRQINWRIICDRKA